MQIGAGVVMINKKKGTEKKWVKECTKPLTD